MLGETGAMAETEDQHDGRDGQDGLKCLQQLFPELGEDDLIMMSTQPFPPRSSAAGRGIEKYILIKYTKTDKSPSTKDRLRLAKKQKCYKKKRLLRFCTAA